MGGSGRAGWWEELRRGVGPWARPGGLGSGGAVVRRRSGVVREAGRRKREGRGETKVWRESGRVGGRVGERGGSPGDAGRSGAAGVAGGWGAVGL